MRALKVLFLFVVLSLAPIQVAYGKIVAVVSSLKGKAFTTYKGQTKMLKVGDHIHRQAEVFTEIGGQLSLNDYYDHVYHLAGGGHIALYNNLVELREGYFWVQSLKFDPLHGPLRVTTANGVVENREGECIVSFDGHSGKTQLLAIKGDFVFKNALMEMKNLTLGEGQFSFIHNDHEEGRPRRATPIGYASYQKVTGLFDGVQPFGEQKPTGLKTRLTTAPDVQAPVAKPSEPARGVASSSGPENAFEAALLGKKVRKESGPSSNSVKYPGPVAGQAQANGGKITVLRLRDPASVKQSEENVMDYYQQKLKALNKPKPKKKWSPAYQAKSGVPVRVFGAKKSGQRLPASVRKKPAVIKVKPGSGAVSTKKRASSRTPASLGKMLPKIKTNAFESQMLKQYKKQMRHDQEVNDLIDQLQSIDMDYKKEY